MMKKEPIEYLLQTNFLDQYIEFCKDLCLRDAVENPTSHILYQSDGYFVNSIDYQYQMNKTCVMIFNEINYADLKFNKYIAKLFQQNITHLESKFNENLSKGFIEDPLLKCFSLWLSNYILTNLTIEESKREGQKFDSMKDTYTTTSKILGEVFADIEHTDLNHMISIVAKVASRCIGFNDEIRAQKWVYLGLEVSIIPQCYAERFRYLFYDIDFFLIQALFILTENPKQLFRDFLEGYSVDSTLNNAFTNMLFAGDETSFEFGSQSDKEVS